MLGTLTETPEERNQAHLDHILRAEKFALDGCQASGLVEGFTWPAASRPNWRGAVRTFHRSPPLPFHGFLHKGAGTCRVCGQPVSQKRTWHPDCVDAYALWTKPATYSHLFVHRQGGLCPSGEPIGPPHRDHVAPVEIDHEVPLFRVAIDHADEPWWQLLRFWGSSNLRALSRAAHLGKCAEEARWRAGRPSGDDRQGALL